MSLSFLEQKPSSSSASHDSTPHVDSGGYFSWSDEEELEEEYFDEESDQDYVRGCDDSEYDNDDCGLYSDHYGDFSVSPKPLPRAPFTTTARLTRPHRNPKSPTVPVIPPEILHLIFSYSDHTTLCRSISRVSRQFNAISKHYVHQELVGKCHFLSEEEEETLLEQLRSGSVNVLRVNCPIAWTTSTGRLPPLDNWYTAWTRLVKLITEPIYTEKNTLPGACLPSNDHLASSTEVISRTRDPKPPCLLDSIRKVELGDPAVPALLPYLHQIHTLEISDQNWRCFRNFYLQPLLKACASLDTLKIDGFRKDYDRLFIRWSEDSIEEQTCSRLTHFSIHHGMSMSGGTMKSILEACPRLRYFKLWKVHISDDPHSVSSWTAPPVAPLYRQAACLRPNLQLLMIIPRQATKFNAIADHLALTAELFPRMQHLEIEAALPKDWSPVAIVSNFLSQITSINIFWDMSPRDVSISSVSRSTWDMDRLLKHCRKLDRLNAGAIKYTRPPRPLHIPSLSSTHRLLNNSGACSWRCRRLRVLDLGLYHLTAEEDEDMFRFLVHACPNLVELSLNLGLSTLRVGQEELVVSTSQEVRTATRAVTRRHKPPSTYTETWTEEVKTEVWQEHKNTFRVLGQLSRLERLEVRMDKLPEVLYPSNFEFLRVSNQYGRRRDGVADEPVFCPRLQNLRIHFWRWDMFGKLRGEPLSEQQFLKELKMIRPKVAISFR